MATYAISDIHGAHDEFVRLLRKIGFRYDGSDTLFLLGDYIDWGSKSMETLLLIKEMDEKYSFVHCTLGNHELMFLQTLDSGYDGLHLNDVAANWMYANRGLVTWEAFLALPSWQQDDLIRWLRSLRLSYTVQVGGLSFMLAHAYPYYYDMSYTPAERRRHQQDAVWRRLLLRENPFSEYHGMHHYDYLICGHTISESYYQDLWMENKWPYRGPQQAGRNRIYRGEMFIDIDCGAKCLELDPSVSEITQMAVMRSQLAALRLDDMEGFYVHHSAVPGMDDMSMAAMDMKESLTAAAGQAAENLSERAEEMEESMERFHLPRLPRILHMPETLRLPQEFHIPEFPELKKFLGTQINLYDFARGIPQETEASAENADAADAAADVEKYDGQ